MTILSPSIVVFFLALLVSFPHFNNATASDACKAATRISPTIDLNFCITSLQSDSTSSSTNALGLAKIVVGLASKHAKTTKAKINKMLLDAAYGNIMPEIHTCRSLYSRMIDYLSTAADGLSSSNYADAKTYLSAALDAPCDCNEAFSKKQAPPVLSNENETVKQLTEISLALVNM
ncbi:putative invertase inhibitor [Carex littledalei]|uniref:Putative invertase inhibitor n=1 Tax=Carex littledalei TaxID=544730 RepID=A0A833R3X0_9POAL|nr:putative invertase inhibitor [Carex littledalei]